MRNPEPSPGWLMNSKNSSTDVRILKRSTLTSFVVSWDTCRRKDVSSRLRYSRFVSERACTALTLLNCFLSPRIRILRARRSAGRACAMLT